MDATIILSFQKEHFNVSYRRCMPRTLAWGLAGLGHECQIGNMAILLTSLLFVFEISFLPISTVSTIMIRPYYKVVLWDIM